MEARNYGAWMWFFIKSLVVAGFIWGIGYWKSTKVPENILVSGPLQNEPVQTLTNKPVFEMRSKGHTYSIQPAFEYELWGLVVSEHSADSIKDNVHESWNDYINTKDICVVWGGNVSNPYLAKLNFSHGSFTCYVQTRDSVAWKSFLPDKISNNHLIPSTPEIQKLISQSNIGDEIRIKGQLVNYNVNKGQYRKTSVNRTDRDNGACEIIYVTEFETYAKNNKFWNHVSKAGKYLSMAFLIGAMATMLFTAVFVKN